MRGYTAEIEATCSIEGFGLAWDGEYTCWFKYNPGSLPSYSWAYGPEPGDPPEVDFTQILRVRLEEEDPPEGVEQDFTRIRLPTKVEQKLYEQCCEVGDEYVSDPGDYGDRD